MASGILSISAFHHHFYDLSLVLYVVSILLLIIIGIPSFWVTKDIVWKNNDYHWKFNRYTLISGIAVVITRTLILSQYFLFSYASILIFLISIASALVFTFHEVIHKNFAIDSAHFSQLNVSVAIASSSIAFMTGISNVTTPTGWFVLYIAFFGVLLSLLFYFAFVALNISKLLQGKYSIGNIDGTLWISMGLPALISLAFYSLTKIIPEPFLFLFSLVTELYLWLWFLATAMLIPVTAISILKIYHVRRIRYHPSLWAVVFPTGVYSFDTTLISRYFSSNYIYSYSVLFDIVSSSLFFLFLLLLILKSKKLGQFF